ncbi:MAG: TonB-dependent receptor [Prevotella sp.]|nr:TonB-dependent receptor [Prevotella sp.]
MKAKRLFTTTCAVVLYVSLHGQDIDKVAIEDTLKSVDVKGVLRGRDFVSTAPKYTLSTENMARLGITDIGNALHKLPGVTLRDYGGAGGLKTVSVRGFGAQHTAVVYDGVALSDCQTGQIDVSRYTLNDVAELSLVVGDNDDIFMPAKNAAAAAALHINTATPPTDDTDMHAVAQMKVGSWGYTNPFIRLEKNISEKFGFSLTGDYIYTKNNYPYTIMNVAQEVKDRRNHNRMNSGHAEANVTYKPATGHLLWLKAYYYDNSRQLPGMVHYYVNESREKMRDQNFFTQLNWRGTLTEKLRMAATAKFNYTMADYEDPSYPNNIKDHQYWQREAYATASLLYAPATQWAMNYSADYTFNNLSGSDVSTYRDPLRHTILQSLTAKYSTGRLTAMARLLHSLYLNGARRGDKAKDVRHVSPSISLNWQLLADEKLYARASYKDIFRSPSFNELYYEHYGSTNLKPERTNQFNLGLTWQHDYGRGSSLTLTADGYYNNVKDKIIAVPYNMFIWTNINMGRVRTLGVDATANLTHRFNDKHTLIANGNYTMQKVENDTDGDDNKGKQIAYTPKHSGGFSIAWENPWVNISANGIFATSRWANNEHYQGTMLKGYTDFGVTAYRKIALGKGGFDLRLDIKNIFNRQYEIVRFYPMPGRSWQMTIKYKI